MNLCLLKTNIINIGPELRQNEIIQLNLEKKLEKTMLKKYGTEIYKKKNLRQSILDWEIWK